MKEIKKYEADGFPLDSVLRGKGDRKIFLVFSTLGEREADLVAGKIKLVRENTGSLIDRIILSHRRTDEIPERTEETALLAWDGTDILICNDFKVPGMGSEKGKGADMRRALYHINRLSSGSSAPEENIVIFLDADVVPEHFGAHFPTALAGAVLGGADFAKASFWREQGRVKKYAAQPLFSLIDHPLLNRMSELSYPLAGEVAGTLAFFNAVSFWQMYGVETGMIVDALMNDFSIADVNLGLYDHEHHGDRGIQKMSFGVMRTFLLQLVHYNIINLSGGASISDIFSTSFIDEKGERKNQ